MSSGCTRHPSNPSAGACRQCEETFCEDCLVFPFGDTKPPMCIGCALAFAGVRPGAAGAPKAERSARPKRFGRRKQVRIEAPARASDYVFDPDEPLFS